MNDTNSRVGSRTGLRRSESAILNDREIWALSDDELEDEENKESAPAGGQDAGEGFAMGGQGGEQ